MSLAAFLNVTVLATFFIYGSGKKGSDKKESEKLKEIIKKYD